MSERKSGLPEAAVRERCHAGSAKRLFAVPKDGAVGNYAVTCRRLVAWASPLLAIR